MDISILDKKVDLSAGTWVDDIPNEPGLRLLVRSINYKPFRVASAGLGRRLGKELRTDEGLAAFNVATGMPMAEHVLLGWEGMTSAGETVKYAPKLALQLLTADDDHGIGNRMRRAVEWAAEQVADKLANTTKDAAGN